MLRCPTANLLIVLCLAIQVWAGSALGGTAVCFGFIARLCPPQQSCCTTCDDDQHGPTQSPPRDQCPPNCGCCITVPMAEQPTIDTSRQDMTRAVTWATLPAHDMVSGPLGRAQRTLARALPPPDRPASPLAVGIASTRIMI